jgi:hypothetical protein
MAELFTVYRLNGLVETLHKLQSFGPYSSHNHATILRLPTARDQLSFFKTVE